MTPKTQVEVTTKCRRLFYSKASGLVISVASGGGALESLTGDALIMATHDDPLAPETVGCVECYYSALGKGPPYSVDLSTVGEMANTSAAHHSNPTDITAQALCDARDACVSYDWPEE
jgi:hypothetical protein